MATPIRAIPCVAGVLVGGKSQRMKQPKALLEMPNGLTFVEHVVRVVSPVSQSVVILGFPLVRMNHPSEQSLQCVHTCNFRGWSKF